MRLLTRYIAIHLLTATAVVLLVLLGLYSFMDLINELEDLGKGNYQFAHILSYMALSTPKRVYDLLPMAALLGSVLGLGHLAAQSELVAMRAAGVSIRKIAGAVLYVALALTAFGFVLGEVVRPYSEQQARALQTTAQTGTETLQSKSGFWTRDGHHFNHIEQIRADGRFSGLKIYEFDEQYRLREVTRAREARFEGGEWVLLDVIQSQLDEAGVEVAQFSEAIWRSKLNPGMLNIVVVPPEYLPVWSLSAYIDYLAENFQATEPYRLAFWSKIIQPISTAVMVLLAVPFVFGPLRSAPMGGRILAGALAGIGFHLVNQTFQHLGLVFGLLPFLAASLPTLVFAGLGWSMMRRVQ